MLWAARQAGRDNNITRLSDRPLEWSGEGAQPAIGDGTPLFMYISVSLSPSVNLSLIFTCCIWKNSANFLIFSTARNFAEILISPLIANRLQCFDS